MLNIKRLSKKGYVLAMSIFFIITLIIIGFGLYASVEHFVKETKLKETGYTKGHYIALATLRYATILLENPAAVFGSEPVEGDSVTKDLWNDYNSFADDIGITASGEASLVIEKIAGDDFEVSAAYNY